MLNGSPRNRPILEQNIAELRKEIGEAATRGSRSAGEITLVAVTKYTTSEIASALLHLGVTNLGESRIQEAERKHDAVKPRKGKTLRWHLIGHLQTNKVRKALALFDLIHSIDSMRLADAVDHAATAQRCRAKVLLQVNISEEETKHGFSPSELLASVKELKARKYLDVQGLMTMAPFSEDPEESRPYFQALAALRDQIRGMVEWPLPHLSMGMTGDFKIAIEEGATIIRVGSFLLRGIET